MQRREFLVSAAIGATFPAISRYARSGPLHTPTPMSASGPLRRHPKNSRYFANAQGQAILLTGSHTWNNLVDMGAQRSPDRSTSTRT